MARLPPATWAEIRALNEAGESAASLARRYGAGLATIRDRKAREGWRDCDRPPPHPRPRFDPTADDAPARPPEVIVAEALGAADRAYRAGELVEAGRHLAIARQFRRFTQDATASARRNERDADRREDRRDRQVNAYLRVLERAQAQRARAGPPLTEAERREELATLREVATTLFPPPRPAARPPDPPDPPCSARKVDGRPATPETECSIQDTTLKPEPPGAAAPPATAAANPSEREPGPPPTPLSDAGSPKVAVEEQPPIAQQLDELRIRIERRMAFGMAYDDVLERIATLEAGQALETKNACLEAPPLLHRPCTPARLGLLATAARLTSLTRACEYSLTVTGDAP
jgi:hypothetical protein